MGLRFGASGNYGRRKEIPPAERLVFLIFSVPLVIGIADWLKLIKTNRGTAHRLKHCSWLTGRAFINDVIPCLNKDYYYYYKQTLKQIGFLLGEMRMKYLLSF